MKPVKGGSIEFWVRDNYTNVLISLNSFLDYPQNVWDMIKCFSLHIIYILKIEADKRTNLTVIFGVISHQSWRGNLSYVSHNFLEVLILWSFRVSSIQLRPFWTNMILWYFLFHVSYYFLYFYLTLCKIKYIIHKIRYIYIYIYILFRISLIIDILL